MIDLEDLLDEYRLWKNYTNSLDNEGYEWKSAHSIRKLYENLIDKMISHERDGYDFPKED